MIQFEIVSPSKPIMRAIIENMISRDYVLCDVPWVSDISWNKLKILDLFRNFEIFDFIYFFWKFRENYEL